MTHAASPLLRPDAFTALYEEHAGAVQAYFARRTDDAATADDLTAETFAQAFAARGRFHDQGEGPAPWLFGIARHQLARHRRTRRVETQARERLAVPAEAQAGEQARVEELVDLAAVAPGLRAGLDALPSAEREAVALRVVETLPYSDVAARLGCSEQAARVRVWRGLRRLAAGVALGLVLAAALDGSGGPSVLARAAQAAEPVANTIEHAVEVTTERRGDALVDVREERWITTGPPWATRVVRTDPRYPWPSDETHVGDVVATYDAEAHVIHERVGLPMDERFAREYGAQDLLGPQRALHSGDATDLGAAELDGRAVRRIDYGSRDGNGQRCSYLAEPADYRPLAVRCTALVDAPWTVSDVRFDWIPRADGDGRQFSLRALHPDARVERGPLRDCRDEPAYRGPGDPRNPPCGVSISGG